MRDRGLLDGGVWCARVRIAGNVELLYVGDCLRVDATFGAVCGFARMEAGCVRAHERMSGDKAHEGSTGRAGAARGAGYGRWEFP